MSNPQPADANPHHLIFIADPQLVDPHTYPGRPWPLSTLTVRYVDLYLSRVYSLLQRNLYPDTTMFLGDLFDGGREWATDDDKFLYKDELWQSYDEQFWMREYVRFSKMFVNKWVDAGVAPRVGQPGRRKLVLSLPGNHDLGFSSGIQVPVRNRFNAYFGDGNRIDIIGNHTFISMDTVSLSAKDHTDSSLQDIWKPSSEFLDTIKPRVKAAINTEFLLRKARHPQSLFPHSLIETEDLETATLPKPQIGDVADLPTVLLTHVPLFRDKGTPCGPLREHWPQARDADGNPLAVDERNALSIAAGYQYQNVLSLEVTKEITSKIGNIKYAFSGDDHDYCEVVHRGYPSNGGIREITVKSISWAMGIRKPGFQMVSLWNPVDGLGNPILQGGNGQSTMQTHMCLLPDQLSIFIRYAILFVFTLSALLLRAGHLGLNPEKSAFGGAESPLLPTVRDPDVSEKPDSNHSSSDEGGSARSSHSLSSNHGRLSSRIVNARTRSVSPRKHGGYGLPPPAYPQEPLIAKAGYFAPKDEQEVYVDTRIRSKTRRLKGLGLFYTELRWSLIRVTSVVLVWYFWLIWRG
jgi:ethanolamine phosphate phosphodiesterase